MLELIHSTLHLSGFAKDVTVRYQNKNFFSKAAGEKMEKYKNISVKLKREFNVHNAHNAQVMLIVW